MATKTAEVRAALATVRPAAAESVGITRGWILDGAGPARFGWGAIHPCKTQWLGYTVADVRRRAAAGLL